MKRGERVEKEIDAILRADEAEEFMNDVVDDEPDEVVVVWKKGNSVRWKALTGDIPMVLGLLETAKINIIIRGEDR